MELSGGQKSLLSISLILAQVRYNPFCLYIFDEARARHRSTRHSMRRTRRVSSR